VVNQIFYTESSLFVRWQPPVIYKLSQSMLTDYNNADRILAIKIRKSRTSPRTVLKIRLFVTFLAVKQDYLLQINRAYRKQIHGLGPFDNPRIPHRHIKYPSKRPY